MSKKNQSDAEEYVEVNKTEIQKTRKKEREEIRKSQAQRRRIEELEDEIHKTETSIDEIDNQLMDNSIYEDHEKVFALDAKRKELSEKLEAMIEEWGELSD